MSAPRPVSLPPSVAELLETLEAGGHRAHVVGQAARVLARGEAAHDWEVSTSADSKFLANQLPGAIAGVGERSWRLASPIGPIVVRPEPGPRPLAASLRERDFSCHALAIDARGSWTDPAAGWADARAGLLRCPEDPATSLGRDPVRALRALRWVSEEGWRLAPDLEAALPERAGAISKISAARLRPELRALLLGAHAESALAALRRSGLENALAPGVLPDAARVVAALPRDPSLRFTGWLRGTRAVRILRRLRMPREHVAQIERLLQLHPIDALGPPEADGRWRRLWRRSGDLVPGLLALRAAEFAAAGKEEPPAFLALRAALECARADEASPEPLALDGTAIMEILGCPPGREVGRALRLLRDAVLADPGANTPERLRQVLIDRAADLPGRTQRGSPE